MYALDAHYADGMTARAVIRGFARAIRMSERCATASWHMAAEYHRAYGIETVPVVPSLDPAFALPPSGRPSSAEQFVIAVAGQLYASDAWYALLYALETVKWRVLGKQVII